MSRVKPILRLVRAQNLFTSVSDSWAGLVMASMFSPAVRQWHFAAAALASTCLYASGAIQNDLADMARDRALHPTRPLPSGQVRPSSAFVAAVLALTVGILAAASLGAAPFVAALAAGGAIVLYDYAVKVSAIPASVTMAFIRFANFSVGLSVAGADNLLARPALLAVPLMPALHVLAVTLVSTFEESDPACGSPRSVRRLADSTDSADVVGATDRTFTVRPEAWLLACLSILCLADLGAVAALCLMLPYRTGAVPALALCALFLLQSGVKAIGAVRRPAFSHAVGRHVSNGVQAITLLNAAVALACGNAAVGIALLIFFPTGVIAAEWLGGS